MQFVEFVACNAYTGVAINNATVEVFLTGTSTPATLYNAQGTSISNPITGCPNGLCGFATPDGAYDIQCSSADGSYVGPLISEVQIVDVLALSALVPKEVMTAAASITGPALVNIGASFHINKANASSGLPAHGYILASVASSGTVPVYFAGPVSGFSGLTPGPVYCDPANPGGITQTPPASGSGYYVQQVGMAVSATTIVFTPQTMNGPL